MRYKAAYKCQICGAISLTPDEFESSPEEATKLVTKILQSQHFEGNAALCSVPTKVLHHCKTNSVGVALFAGLYVV